jgi:DeoR/GlpR family transcriptional regulator of sugar metabolism
MLLSRMLAEERKQTILTLLRKNGSVRTADLAQMLSVSDQTIRRDFWDLEALGLVSKKHGGAVLVNYQSVPYQERAILLKDAKMAIARAAARTVKPKMVVALGPGTTTEMLAQVLNGLTITLVTNSLTVARAVTHANTEVWLTGGRYRAGSELVTGRWAEDTLSDFFADLCFVGVSGIDPSEGYTVTEADEAKVLRQFIRIAKTSVIVSDATKFHRVAKEVVAPPGAVHRLITDPDIAAADRERLEAAGVEVVIASSG